MITFWTIVVAFCVPVLAALVGVLAAGQQDT